MYGTVRVPVPAPYRTQSLSYVNCLDSTGSEDGGIETRNLANFFTGMRNTNHREIPSTLFYGFLPDIRGHYGTGTGYFIYVANLLTVRDSMQDQPPISLQF
jgi:hypothetical protein